MNRPKGKIIKTRTGYKVKAMALYLLKIVPLQTPCKITLSDRWDWCRHDCCICGRSFRTYTPNAHIYLAGPGRNYFPICDDCLKANCPEFYDELKKRRIKFDKEIGYDKELDKERAEADPDVPF